MTNRYIYKFLLPFCCPVSPFAKGEWTSIRRNTEPHLLENLTVQQLLRGWNRKLYECFRNHIDRSSLAQTPAKYSHTKCERSQRKKMFRIAKCQAIPRIINNLSSFCWIKFKTVKNLFPNFPHFLNSNRIRFSNSYSFYNNL